MNLGLTLTLGKLSAATGIVTVWILATGTWNDAGTWDDAATWID